MTSYVELSLVIPVFNGSQTIGPLLHHIHAVMRDISFEVVLVNDGSSDDTDRVCSELVEEFPETVVYLNLARNFGEHNAVLAGLKHTLGDYVAVLDDDGQHAPEDALRMLAEMKRGDYDVVYGRYAQKFHSRFRNLGSWFNDRMANIMLRKPPGLYLSSFKVMNRFLVEEVSGYHGSFPYIDGLVIRATSNIGQITVGHREREVGRSNYTLRKLLGLWLNMFLNFSILPLRLTAIAGMLTSLVSLFLLVGIVIDKVWFNPNLTVGIPTVLITIVFFSGIQLLLTGMVGEYLGRLFLDHSGTPQFVIRSVKGRGCGESHPSGRENRDAAASLPSISRPS